MTWSRGSRVTTSSSQSGMTLMICSKQNCISVVAWRSSRSIVALGVPLRRHWFLMQSTSRALALQSLTSSCGREGTVQSSVKGYFNWPKPFRVAYSLNTEPSINVVSVPPTQINCGVLGETYEESLSRRFCNPLDEINALLLIYRSVDEHALSRPQRSNKTHAFRPDLSPRLTLPKRPTRTSRETRITTQTIYFHYLNQMSPLHLPMPSHVT